MARRHPNGKVYLATLVREALADPDVRRHVLAQLRRYGELARLIETSVVAAAPARTIDSPGSGTKE